jgi:CHAT domain-containing protein
VSISFSVPDNIQCPQCPASFEAELWVIIDAGERADLWKRCLDGTIYDFVCPSGHIVVRYFPIMLYNAKRGTLVFCSQSAVPTEKEIELAKSMGAHVQRSLPMGAAATPIKQIIPVPYRLLPAYLFLTEPPVHECPLSETRVRIRAFEKALSSGEINENPELRAVFEFELGKSYHWNSLQTQSGDIDSAIAVVASAVGHFHDLDRCLDLADAQRFLADCYSARSQDNPSDLEKAATALQGALENYEKLSRTREVAAIQKDLADLLMRMKSGDLEENRRRAIELYQIALEHYTKDSSLHEWTEIQNSLGDAYMARAMHGPEEDKANNIDAAIRSYEAALASGSSADSRQSAFTKEKLALAYEMRISGVHADNLDKALALDESAVSYWSSETRSDDWAHLYLTIGNLYLERTQGDRNHNIESAISAFRSALTVFQPANSPDEWAMAHVNQGKALIERAGDEPVHSIDIEEAIRAYKAALEVYNISSRPEQWAAVQNNLGAAYSRRTMGDRSENQDHSIASYEAALSFYGRESADKNSANIQRNIQSQLSQLYADRINGDPTENLERAIRIGETYLNVLHNENPSYERAFTQHNLAIRYLDRKVGSRSDNVERSIELLQESLSICTRQEYPEEWANIQSSLANAFEERIRGDRTANIEMAIEASMAALSYYTRNQFPDQWARIQSILAGLYMLRIQGDHAENIERSIYCSESALEVRTRQSYPDLWAKTQVRRADAYLRRVRGDRGYNVEDAIDACHHALEVFTKDQYPRGYADANHTLGIAYINRIRSGRTQNLEQAIQSFEKALTLKPPLIHAYDWAMTQNALGHAYMDRVLGDRSENQERSKMAFETALGTYTREGFPVQWAMVQNNLGVLYRNRVAGDRISNLDQSSKHLKAALDVYKNGNYSAETLMAANNLGVNEFQRQHWDDAHSAFLIAIDSAGQLYSRTVTGEGKLSIIEDAADLFAYMVDTCLRLTPPRTIDALLHSEEGRSRLLREQLGEIRVSAPARIPAELLEKERQLLTHSREIENAIQDTLDNSVRQTLIKEAISLRIGLNEMWDTFASTYRAAEYVALRRGERLEWQDIQDWLSAQNQQVAILEFFTLDDGIAAFIIRANQNEPVAERLQISKHQLGDLIERYIYEVHGYTTEQPSAETWKPIASLLFGNLIRHLGGIQILYVIPHHLLHLLPFHAIDMNGKRLIEYFPIVYAPSIAVAMRMAETSSEQCFPKGNALVIGNPSGNLRFAEEEAKEIACHFGVEPLLRGQATKAKVQALLPTTALMHFATHAYFDPEESFGSGITLANSETLTARELLMQSLNARLAVISGCETGLQEIRAGDELIGLARAFMYAGVPALIVSLWPVNDQVTKKLMLTFYAYLYDEDGLKKTSTAEALRKAMLEIGAEHPHTFHWAPFTLHGTWR